MGAEGVETTVAPWEPGGSQRFTDRLAEICCSGPSSEVHAARQAGSGYETGYVLP